LRCMSPLLAQNGHRLDVEGCPLSELKQTSLFDCAMSAFDPKQTSAASLISLSFGGM
jgi:hypothetical protein